MQLPIFLASKSAQIEWAYRRLWLGISSLTSTFFRHSIRCTNMLDSNEYHWRKYFVRKGALSVLENFNPLFACWNSVLVAEKKEPGQEPLGIAQLLCLSNKTHWTAYCLHSLVFSCLLGKMQSYFLCVCLFSDGSGRQMKNFCPQCKSILTSNVVHSSLNEWKEENERAPRRICCAKQWEKL